MAGSQRNGGGCGDRSAPCAWGAQWRGGGGGTAARDRARRARAFIESCARWRPPASSRPRAGGCASDLSPAPSSRPCGSRTTGGRVAGPRSSRPYRHPRGLGGPPRRRSWDPSSFPGRASPVAPPGSGSAFSNASMNNPWRVALVHGIEYAAANLGDRIERLTILHAGDDGRRQQADIAQMIAQRVDGLIVSAVAAANGRRCDPRGDGARHRGRARRSRRRGERSQNQLRHHRRRRDRPPDGAMARRKARGNRIDPAVARRSRGRAGADTPRCGPIGFS